MPNNCLSYHSPPPPPRFLRQCYSTFNFSANKNRKQNRNSTLFVQTETKTETEAKFHNRTSLHSTHFILRLYGVGHMVKDHSDNERGNPLPPYGLLFPINSKGYFICIIPYTGYHIPRSLLLQSWITRWNEK